jgi:7-carboxy-7-deazaguanine synthase
MESTLLIAEIFRSIQGESTRAGVPCAFVRLAGCDLRCSYCDTKEALSGGKRLPLSAIVETVGSFSTNLVEITGGEPLLQPEVHVLMGRLADLGHLVLLETSGAHDISGVDPRVIRIIDIKCPSSGEAGRNRWSNFDCPRESDEVKFVIADRIDFDWARAQVARLGLSRKCTVLFSPVWEALPARTLAEWVLDSGLNVRVQPQLHKLLWGATPST